MKQNIEMKINNVLVELTLNEKAIVGEFRNKIAVYSGHPGSNTVVIFVNDIPYVFTNITEPSKVYVKEDGIPNNIVVSTSCWKKDKRVKLIKKYYDK